MDGVAVAPVHLWLEEKVGCEALRDIRINPFRVVLDEKSGCGGLAVFVEHLETDRMRRHDGEQNVDVVAEAYVLRALPDVEAEGRGSLADIAAVDLQDGI